MMYVQIDSWLKLHAGICPERAVLTRQPRRYITSKKRAYISLIAIWIILLPPALFSQTTKSGIEVNPQPVVNQSSQTDKPGTAGITTSEKTGAAEQGPKKTGLPRETTPVFNPIYLLIGVALGLLLGVIRLVSRFLPFLGLGVLTNSSSVMFLVYVSATTMLFYGGILFLQTKLGQELLSEDSIWTHHLLAETISLVTILGSPIAGNISTILGRLVSAKALDTGSTKDIKDMDKSKSSNIMFELVRRSLAEKLYERIIEMSRLYEWDIIKSAISRLIDSEIAFKNISAQEGEAVRAFIMGFEKSDDAVKDMDNKCKVLHRVIQFSSFRMLVLRLERLRKYAV